MKLLRLHRAQKAVLALLRTRGTGDECEVINFLKSAGAQYQGSAKGYKVLFQRYSLGLKLTYEQFHPADKKQEIMQFIKGDFRVFCFTDGDDLIILTHATLKKSQKADPQQVALAVEKRKQYLAAKQRNEVEIVEMANDYL